MDVRKIKDDHKYIWTLHAKYKLLQYNLGSNLIKRIVRFPDRKEEGIAPNTVAVMKTKGKEARTREIWVMYQRGIKNKRGIIKGDSQIANFNIDSGKIKIISAWIYPGISPKGKEIMVPEDVWAELEKYHLK